MNNLMIIAVIPLGCADKVIKAANEAGATGATIFHGRGTNQTSEGLFSFKIEPEEEIVVIAASEKVTNLICTKLHDEFIMNNNRNGSIYVLPIQCFENAAMIE